MAGVADLLARPRLRTIHGGAECSGRAVDVLECWRNSLQEPDGAFGAQGGVVVRHAPDLRDSFRDSLDHKSRTTPPKDALFEPRLESPLARGNLFQGSNPFCDREGQAAGLSPINRCL